MKPAPLLAIGIGLLVAAQGVSTYLVAPQRQAFTPLQDVYSTLTPGEFAGTLMLGGFRGVACDLLWMRADLAKEGGRFYESFALFQAISKIQPRFAMPWQHMAWDLAYNLSHEVNDPEAKWAWIKAGIEVNRNGLERNPQSEPLLRFLAWLFHHKGDLFKAQVEREDWSKTINPIIAEVNRRCREKDPTATEIALLAPGPGNRTFQISAQLYRCCVALTDQGLYKTAAFVRRMVPLDLEGDANDLRDKGQHLKALSRYLDALEEWQVVREWALAGDANARLTGNFYYANISYEQNEGRLRRKTATLVRALARDPAVGEQVVKDVQDRRFAEVRRVMAKADAFRPTAVDAVRITWLDGR